MPFPGAQLQFLGYSLRPSEAALTIWEVDDDADGRIDWEEFKGMFYRIRDDQSGYEPRKLFNVVEFIMHDKNYTGSIDLDEAVTLITVRYGKVRAAHLIRAASHAWPHTRAPAPSPSRTPHSTNAA